MADLKLKGTGRNVAGRFVLLAALLWGVKLAPGWAGQRPVLPSPSSTKKPPATAPKKETGPPERPVKTPAKRPVESVPRLAGQRPVLPSPSSAKKPVATTSKKETARPEKHAKTPAKTQAEISQAAPPVVGKRDPFKLPPAPSNKPSGESIPESAAALPPGTRGLIISQLRLEGIVRQNTSNKMLAVVTNETKRAYFLTENEAVYNGVVSKITPDSVYFNENVLDQNGRVSTREVVKRLGAAPGDVR